MHHHEALALKGLFRGHEAVVGSRVAIPSVVPISLVLATLRRLLEGRHWRTVSRRLRDVEGRDRRLGDFSALPAAGSSFAQIRRHSFVDGDLGRPCFRLADRVRKFSRLFTLIALVSVWADVLLVVGRITGDFRQGDLFTRGFFPGE